MGTSLRRRLQGHPDFCLLDRSAPRSRAGDVRASRSMVPADGDRPGGISQLDAAAIREVGDFFTSCRGVSESRQAAGDLALKMGFEKRNWWLAPAGSFL